MFFMRSLFSFGLLLDINFRSSLNIWSDEHLSQSKANVLAHTQSKDLAPCSCSH